MGGRGSSFSSRQGGNSRVISVDEWKKMADMLSNAIEQNRGNVRFDVKTGKIYNRKTGELLPGQEASARELEKMQRNEKNPKKRLALQKSIDNYKKYQEQKKQKDKNEAYVSSLKNRLENLKNELVDQDMRASSTTTWIRSEARRRKDFDTYYFGKEVHPMSYYTDQVKQQLESARKEYTRMKAEYDKEREKIISEIKKYGGSTKGL